MNGYKPEKKTIFYLSNEMANNHSYKKLTINRNGIVRSFGFDMRRGEQIRRRLDNLVADDRGAIFGLSTYSFKN